MPFVETVVRSGDFQHQVDDRRTLMARALGWHDQIRFPEDLHSDGIGVLLVANDVDKAERQSIGIAEVSHFAPVGCSKGKC